MIEWLNALLWGKVLIFVLIPVGLWFTFRSRFVQARHFAEMFAIFGQAFKHKTDHPSSFQALALSVAGRVGAGNIAGVAVAITLGGPGAVFWMWLVGLVGMATSFFECSLAQLFKRKEPSGDFRGGPAFYIQHGLKKRLGPVAPVLAGVYSVLLLVAFGFAFNVLQSYAVSTSVSGAFGVDARIVGVVLAVFVGLVIFGGVKRITSVVEFIVPVMALSYILLVLFILATRIADVPHALLTIVESAFGFNEAVAGGVGAALTQGIRRGLFSNEAGLGSAPNVAAVAYVPHPAQQGVVQAFSVFIDTIIICTCTASIILLSGVDLSNPDVDGVILTQTALAAHVGGWADEFVATALLLFVFSSIMYNYFLGENALDFFTHESRMVFTVFRIATLGFVLVGANLDLSAAFGFADAAMGLLALVNLFALVLLFPIGLRVMRDFDGQRKKGLTPVFDPADYPDLDIDEAAWKLEPEDAARLQQKRNA
ncbi:alanine/glycine:cation symporter family protein [Hyphococcus luteus]|uniref:Sodium:alanine symporter n=1 Tax=Hyphococcus luteus TaxID=2058213 RepID=A0A2S7K7X6_9PROT|nr:alanine/glycine:cation symporter family protein [Marinicaulis flavus]PQA88568.1 sodium:alanine symporter [Marinicaulis flavus]